MKKQITGYITGVINSYSRTIERLKESGAPITSTNSFVAFKEEFTDLLEFVMDIPEENKEVAILAFNIALENTIFKKRILELEESCESMNEIENNLHKRIKALTDNNDSLDNNCNVLRNHNNKLIKVNFELAQCNKNQVQMIRKLRYRNKQLARIFKY
ncbi:hypothetical protein [Clostridium tagluense]|uniref:Uncharacterized protein n=1 Tax=Clostridium tagluense TaxID=360422 RepID=A0A401UUE9_9CLOT|nr:hypothetical protein [Clostridium tagluense]GCD13173.1 hypothetical protein Ctaglu_47960 [Clostridium tagluense]